MGTRSGDLDPALVGFLARKEQKTGDQVDSLLRKKSGLRGVSGTSADTCDLVQDFGDRANLALNMFAYRARKYFGPYLAAMNGAAAVVFGGGIGENTSLRFDAESARLPSFKRPQLDFGSSNSGWRVNDRNGFSAPG